MKRTDIQGTIGKRWKEEDLKVPRKGNKKTAALAARLRKETT
jgi:hypothetical protein